MTLLFYSSFYQALFCYSSDQHSVVTADSAFQTFVILSGYYQKGVVWPAPRFNDNEDGTHYGYHDPAVPNTAGTGYWTEGDPFSNVQNNVYWTSSSNAGNTSPAWGIQMQPGTIVDTDKTGSYYLWPVRGGH
jgi:hypothetical protein